MSKSSLESVLDPVGRIRTTLTAERSALNARSHLLLAKEVVASPMQQQLLCEVGARGVA